ncbi:threonine synthase [Asticcacaulis sp. BYS171W]|uniref:Threonine synthase n=1 Tax=Asticcacaulis aquaticus TaxID=2984212 RepID=A0ABT5HR89_9CAUL|nr:threonine synthase [Asticcacaulis aquaticus]MDC7682586.1 threonine synthase [Asticcacaulis aquaticus]
MNYIGTRGFNEHRTFSGALLDGLAPDGGLYVPQTWPTPDFDLKSASAGGYGDLTVKLLNLFGVNVLGDHAVKAAAQRTEDAFLRNGEVPLTKLDDNLWLLELYHGPTHAFKDMAMQMMAPLTDAALAQRGKKLTLVTATSGDTGAAAVRAFAGSEHVKLVVFHPLGRVSPVQRLQMTTVQADNVLNVGVEGDFDDCQRIVKALLSEPVLKQQGLISSVNSINWGRLLGQVPYYLAAAAHSGADKPEFVVPTGNFGDAFAGWVARKIGGNVGHLHAAVNRNDALNQAINNGKYVRRQATETASVSMDVQAPSNFERLVYEASGRDADVTRTLFNDFAATGDVTLPADLQAALKAEVSASTVSEETTKATIKLAYEKYGQVICPHTAVALAAALERRSDAPQIVLSTAHPAKFPAFVTEALGFEPKAPDAITDLYGLTETLTEMPADVAAAVTTVRSFIEWID